MRDERTDLPPGAEPAGSIPAPVACTGFAVTVGLERSDGLGAPTLVCLTMEAAGVARSYALSADSAERLSGRILESVAECRPGDPAAVAYLDARRKREGG